jgi:hypothetical protein
VQERWSSARQAERTHPYRRLPEYRTEARRCEHETGVPRGCRSRDGHHVQERWSSARQARDMIRRRAGARRRC